MDIGTLSVGLLVMMGSFACGGASGQPTPAEKPAEPEAKPAESQQPTESAKPTAEVPFVRPAEPPKVAPTREAPAVMIPTTDKGKPVTPAKTAGVIPGLAKEDPSLPARRFYPEGTFLSKRAGRLVKVSTGDVVFVPARDSKGKGEAPMVVLPTQTLARLEAAPGVFAETSSVVLSGEVYVYFDRQYVLPTVYSVERQLVDAPAGNTPPTPHSTPAAPAGLKDPKPETTSSAAADPAVADLIQDLESKRGSAKAPEISPTQAASGASGGATDGPESKQNSEGAPGSKAAGSLTTEGSVLFNKRARLTRVATGPLMVSFDGDSASSAPAGMVLLRCRMAQKLDELAASRGDDLVVQVSGRVFVYGGRNYLLPTLAQVVPKGDVKSLQ